MIYTLLVRMFPQVGMKAAAVFAEVLFYGVLLSPGVYFWGQVQVVNRQLAAKEKQLIEQETTLKLLKAQADEQKRALTNVYSLSEARNKKLKAQLDEARKAPPPKDCEGSMQWLRDKAQELKP